MYVIALVRVWGKTNNNYARCSLLDTPRVLPIGGKSTELEKMGASGGRFLQTTAPPPTIITIKRDPRGAPFPIFFMTEGEA